MKKKEVIITVKKREDSHGSITQIEIKGKLDKDMARYTLERIVREFEKKPWVRWWEFWK